MYNDLRDFELLDYIVWDLGSEWEIQRRKSHGIVTKIDWEKLRDKKRDAITELLKTMTRYELMDEIIDVCGYKRPHHNESFNEQKFIATKNVMENVFGWTQSWIRGRHFPVKESELCKKMKKCHFIFKSDDGDKLDEFEYDKELDYDTAYILWRDNQWYYSKTIVNKDEDGNFDITVYYFVEPDIPHKLRIEVIDKQ